MCVIMSRSQGQQPTRGGTVRCHQHLQIVVNSFLKTALGQLAAAELTHHSLKPLRLPYSSRLRLSLLLAGDVHPNPSPATQYPCAVCTSNVTSRGVSFKCNQCSGWVHSKCSGLQNAAQYRKTKDWACSSCNSPPAPSPPPAPPPPTPTTTINDAHFTILQWNANGIGNKIDELGIFMEKHNLSGRGGGVPIAISCKKLNI